MEARGTDSREVSCGPRGRAVSPALASRFFRVFGQSPFDVRTVRCALRVCALVTVAYCEVIMDAPGGAREPRFGSPYGMGLLGEMPDMYGAGRPPSSLGGGGLRPGMQPCPMPRGVKRPSDQCYDERPSQSVGLDHCPMPDISDDGYAALQPKKSPPSNGKKTKGRVKIKMEYIDNKLRRYTTFSKRKTGIMKKVGCGDRFWQYSIWASRGMAPCEWLPTCVKVHTEAVLYNDDQ